MTKISLFTNFLIYYIVLIQFQQILMIFHPPSISRYPPFISLYPYISYYLNFLIPCSWEIFQDPRGCYIFFGRGTLHIFSLVMEGLFNQNSFFIRATLKLFCSPPPFTFLSFSPFYLLNCFHCSSPRPQICSTVGAKYWDLLKRLLDKQST